MKRSEMINIIKYFLFGNSNAPEHENESIALLNTIEKSGMVPPEIEERSWKLESNGVMTYAVHEWEEE